MSVSANDRLAISRSSHRSRGALRAAIESLDCRRLLSVAAPADHQEGDVTPPVGVITVDNVTSSGGHFQTVKVEFTDDVKMDPQTIGGSDISVVGPQGALVVLSAAKDVAPSGVVTATYTVIAQGGSWDAGDNGSYTVSLLADAVLDDAGNPATAAPATFTVNIPAADATPPTASVAVTDVTTAGGASHTVAVTYSDNAGVDLSSIGVDDLTVTGPGGVRSVSAVNVSGAGASVVATYTIDAPPGGWQFANNGSYAVSVAADAVRDTAGNGNAATAGAFNVSIAAPDTSGPTTTVSASNIGAAGGATNVVTIVYSDASGVVAGGVDVNDIGVVGPGGTALSVTGATFTGGGTSVTATYTVAAPGGAWDAADNGAYAITVHAGAVTDAAGNPSAAATHGFNVNVAAADTQAPIASLSAAPINSAGATSAIVTVTFADNQAIDFSSIDPGDVTITGPGGAKLSLISLDANPKGNVPAVTATYTFAAPGGAWDSADNGTYIVAYAGGVRDASGNAAPATSGGFAVAIPAADTTGPTATITAENITTAGGSTHTATVVYSDNVSVDASTIDVGDLVVTAPDGFALKMKAVSVDPAGNGSSLTAVYTFESPSKKWGKSDDGVYAVALQPGAVRDTSGNAVAGSTTNFNVNIAGPAASPPTARITVSEITAEATTQTVSVAYASEQGIDASSIDVSDLTVTGPAGALTIVGVSVSGSGSAVTAIYTLAGSFDASNNGSYSVNLVAGAVLDTGGQSAPAASASFKVNIPRRDDAAPVAASISSPDIALAGGNTQTVVVTYTDDLGIDRSTLGADDITVSGPGGATLAVANVNVGGSVNATTVTVTYTLTPPGGTWSFTDNGTYTINVNAGQVRDISGNGVASATAGFTVRAPDPGPADPAFGGGAVVPAHFTAESIISLPDGRIVVAGRQGNFNAGASQAVLQRFNADGSVDSTFGSGAMVIGAAGLGEAYYAVALTGDGRILAAGTRGGDFVVARYTADGKIDASFGDGGRTIVDFGSTTDAAYAIAIGSAGQIVVGGASDGNFAFAELDASGRLNETFGQRGKQLFDMGAPADQIGALVVQSDGRVVAAGASGTAAVVLRLGANGEADPSFSGDGVLTIPGLAARDDSASPDHSLSLALQPDGRILIANKTPGGDFGLARVDSSGNLDSSFGTAGIASADFGGDDDADSVLLQETGQILVVGTTYLAGAPKTGIAAFDASGRLINGFGTGGRVTLDAGVTTQGRELHVGDLVLRAFGSRQSDGRLVIGTSDQSPVPASSALRRVIVPGSAAQSQGSMIGAFGLVNGKRTTLAFTDDDGTKIVVTLKGGSGTAYRADGKIRFVIDTAGTSATLSVKGKGGDGRVNLSDVTITGSLRGFSCKNADLAGTLSVTGVIGKLTLGDIDSGVIAAAGGSIAGLAATNLNHAYVLSGANLGADGRLGGSGADADTYAAGSIGAVKLSGKMIASIIGAGLDPTDGVFLDDDDVVIGGAASAIKSVSVRAGADADSRFAAGAIKSAAVPRKLKKFDGDPLFEIM